MRLERRRRRFWLLRSTIGGLKPDDMWHRLLGSPEPVRKRRDGPGSRISKAGTKLARQTLVELAWFWLRYQPNSKLSLWWHERFGGMGMRGRKVGIVALARKLVIALWRFVEEGAIPEGAMLKV